MTVARAVMNEVDLIFMIKNIYVNSNLELIAKFSSSNKSTGFKDIFSWNISQVITKAVPISTRIVISCTMKRGILFLF